MLQKLPLGIHTFSTLRNDNCVYIDKTEHAYNLITKGYRYFLSRPRRFGKSLFVSTLKEILTANKSLFDGLWIAQSDYHWKEHGVIALNFSGAAGANVEQFNEMLCQTLIEIAEAYQIAIDIKLRYPAIILHDLTYALYKRFGRVAILIDEYDAAILDTLDNDKHGRDLRMAMHSFLAMVKSLDAQVYFTFICGETSFALGINNLVNITREEQYAAISDYTEEELDDNLDDHIL